jgi:hypothetical protein
MVVSIFMWLVSSVVGFITLNIVSSYKYKCYYIKQTETVSMFDMIC